MTPVRDYEPPARRDPGHHILKSSPGLQSTSDLGIIVVAMGAFLLLGARIIFDTRQFPSYND